MAQNELTSSSTNFKWQQGLERCKYYQMLIL